MISSRKPLACLAVAPCNIAASSGVVATGQVRPEAQADGEQRRRLAGALPHATAGGRENTRHQAQHGGFAHAVATDNAQRFAFVDLQGHPVEDVVGAVVEGLAPRLDN